MFALFGASVLHKRASCSQEDPVLHFMPTVLMRLFFALLVLVGLSVTVIWMMPGDALARPVFQSPLTPTVTRTATSTSTQPITGTRPVTPTVTAPPVAPTVAAAPPLTATRSITPAVAPARPPEQPAATVAPAAPGVPGFLPPPTLNVPTGKLQPLLPGPGQPLVAPPAPTLAPRPAAAASTSDALSLARLIDEGIVALSYLWLCCGVLMLVVAALVIVWLARRSKRA